MLKKIIILGTSAFLLGGCTLTDAFKINNAARDANPSPIATSTPAPSPAASEDLQLKVMPSTSSSSDEKSLETDIGATTIIKEDFSNLK